MLCARSFEGSLKLRAHNFRKVGNQIQNELRESIHTQKEIVPYSSIKMTKFRTQRNDCLLQYVIANNQYYHADQRAIGEPSISNRYVLQ